MIQKMTKKRCAWAKPDNQAYVSYHDTEWGVPVHDDRVLFEFVILESAQAGLSWETILKKRAAYRQAFAHFDPEKVARFTPHDVERLMKNAGIVRNRLKITSTITGAQIFLALQKEYGSFSTYAWQFAEGISKKKPRQSLQDIPTVTPEAEAFAKDMKQRGFKFFGPTIAYAFMQAVGMVNDHAPDCFRSKEIQRNYSQSHVSRKLSDFERKP